MKNIIYLFVLALFFASCEDNLETEDLTRKNTSNFPETVDDANQMITAVYNTLNTASANPQDTYFYAACLASDDQFGGGGENDKLMQALDLIMNYNNSMLENFWTVRYQGIFRANTVVETIDNCDGWDSDDQKNQLLGEAYFLRAFFYFEMASYFGQVPLVVTTEPLNLPKAEPEELYAQIASDLKMAIEIMPSTVYSSIESGHATKWAAEALMARVFLFYTGFYSESTLPLTDGGTVAKTEVVSWLEDCIQNSGHSLVEDYRELWAYTNKYTVEDYTYTAEQDLTFAENDEDVNPESLFAIKYSNFADWETTIGYSNQYMLHFGLRGGQSYENTFPFGQGWGAGPVNPTLWEDWEDAEPDDIRRSASIIDLPNDLPNYSKGGWNDFVQETDYWQKKYCPVTAYNDDGSLASSYSVPMYGITDNMQLDNVKDLVMLRLADVYLMHSELTETNTYMNMVRERAGLDDIAYSLENIQNERRWELAFEGTRWNDIRRWGIAADVLQAQIGVDCYYKGEADVTLSHGGGYKARYEATGGGFFPIPEDEISLSDGVLVQNDGWGDEAEYSGWK